MAVAGKAGKMALTTNTVADIQNWTLDAGFDMLEDTALLDTWKSFVSGLGLNLLHCGETALFE